MGNRSAMENTLNGRKAVVTGGASGIGAACVRELAARGAKVVVADVDSAGAAALADEVGGTSWAVDLLDVDKLTTLSLDCDILVNNAGIQRINPIEAFDPADFRRIIALMLEAPFLLIRAALPHMYANGFGRIINVSSVHGIRASPFKSAYVSAKHGLEGLSKVAALEGGGAESRPTASTRATSGLRSSRSRSRTRPRCTASPSRRSWPG
ncbi:D-beta-hydroxybutyrate dehydrogenase [Arthrobacter sp. Hiyo4]|nr:D-beta-hydroxybutyrate dehydrogenase [Arthrobacter sp. Hiyo4]